MHIIVIAQDEENTVTLMASNGTSDKKALELCRAAVTIYAAEVRDAKDEIPLFEEAAAYLEGIK